MKSLISGTPVSIVWSYSRIPAPWLPTPLLPDAVKNVEEVIEKTTMQTTCYIWEKLEGGRKGHLLGVGRSIVHQGDVFKKSEGRKRSLTRALRTVPRKDRTRIWNDYKEMRHGKW